MRKVVNIIIAESIIVGIIGTGADDLVRYLRWHESHLPQLEALHPDIDIYVEKRNPDTDTGSVDVLLKSYVEKPEQTDT